MNREWARWLRRQLDTRGLKPIDVERLSPRKPAPRDDRPVIDRSSVGNWLKGNGISITQASVLAGILDVPLVELMEAAGLPTVAADHVMTFPAESGREAFIVRLEDEDEMRAVTAFRRAWRAAGKRRPDRP